MMYKLEEKVVIVTGSGRPGGIGEAIVSRFAAEGCHVVVSDLGQAKGADFPENAVGTTAGMEEVAEKCRSHGVQVMTVPCDVRKSRDMENLVRAAVDVWGRLDIFVNNAGVGYLMQLVTEMEEEQWDTVLEVNLKGYFMGIKYAARQMIAQGHGGRIINVGSQASKSGFPYATAYTASKHAIVGLTRASAIELGPHKITVNTVCPNHITTGLGAWQNDFFAEKLGLTPEEYKKQMLSRMPLGRTGRVEDIARACAFLASDQADYITGEAMNVSGGEEMH